MEPRRLHRKTSCLVIAAPASREASAVQESQLWVSESELATCLLSGSLGIVPALVGGRHLPVSAQLWPPHCPHCVPDLHGYPALALEETWLESLQSWPQSLVVSASVCHSRWPAPTARLHCCSATTTTGRRSGTADRISVQTPAAVGLLLKNLRP